MNFVYLSRLQEADKDYLNYCNTWSKQLHNIELSSHTAIENALIE